MGVVYKAHDTKLDRTVALKFLPAHLSASEDDRTRFLQEARAAAALSHPNICTIFAIEEFRDQESSTPQYFFAMEFVEGKTMRQAMPEITLQRALDIGSQVAEGLAAAHNKGIVHRDIKAENIMLRPDGRVQIMDFGLAKVKGGSPLTKTGSTVGTMGYMSPEQIQGMDVDYRADIFSLGVLLYEMATGRLPFTGVHDAAIMYEIVNVQPPMPSEVKEGIPGEFDRIVNKSLAKDREERYQSARDIAVDLKVLKKQSGSSIATGAHAVTPRPGSSGSRAAVPQPTPSSPGDVGMPSSGIEQPGSLPEGSGITAAPNRKPVLYGIAAVILIVVVAVFWFIAGSGPAGTISSMVVLPFDNVGNDPDLEYLSDGVTEGIINKVSRISNLRVIPRSASFRFKGSAKDPRAIGEELGVDAVLSGRVVQRGDRLDMTLELIDVKAYAQIWGENYKRTMNDLMSVQDEIVDEVTGKIRPGTEPGSAVTVKSETANPAAYRFYLQGKFYWNKRTASALERALGYYNQAIGLDPGFARAHLGLAETYLLQGEYSDRPEDEILPLAETEAMKSLELDNSLGEAHATLGMVREGQWDWEGAEREFKLAIEKAPDYATAYHWYFIFLGMMGKAEEGLEVIKKGAELDPYSPIVLVNLVDGYVSLADYVNAEKTARRILEIDPQFFFGQFRLAEVLHETGRDREALNVLEGIQLTDLPSLGLGYVGYLYAALGKKSTADSILDLLHAGPGGRRSDPVGIAALYAGFGNADSTMAWLEKAYNQPEKSRTLAQTRGHLEFKFVQNDPRYHALLKKMGLM